MPSNNTDLYKRAGYLLGLGIVSSGVKDENEIALAVLSSEIDHKE